MYLPTAFVPEGAVSVTPSNDHALTTAQLCQACRALQKHALFLIFYIAHAWVQAHSPNHSRYNSQEEVLLRESEQHADAAAWDAPIIHLDGPAGAPAQNYKDYKVLLLVVCPLACP